ncbi:glycoside hydrolase family 15 protein [Haloarchaeobius amylolyticus]|uniref:glycoside hydrolase family 15 protein n=1 Tax=Haloarchaeobius amylolyticus TaxID=1198296 RepID=UPI00226FD7A3|nr:glycoside hydrolase family 15 protein [Haloarchaeobius amylolyticus]
MSDESEHDRSGSTRRALLGSLGGVAAVGLAGCNGQSDGSGTTADTGTTAGAGTGTGTTTATPELDPVELAPFWTTGEKYGLGTVADHAADESSRVWFTLTAGALTEPRFPRVDLMHFRTVDFLVTDGEGYVARSHDQSRRDDDPVERRVVPAADDALLYRHEVAASDDRDWSLQVEYAADPAGDAILMDVAFDAADEFDLYLVARPAISAATAGDAGVRVTDGDGYALAAEDAPTGGPVLDEDGNPYVVAASVAAADGFDWATAAGVKDESAMALVQRGEALDPSDSAEGNLVLAGRLGSGSTETTAAIGFVQDAAAEDATAEARRALDRGYEAVRAEYRASWRSFFEDVRVPDSVAGDDALEPQYRTAAMALRAVEDKTFHGAGIASPSVPWGKGVIADKASDVGYNFVWSRDLYQAFTALDAMGHAEAAIAATEYLLTVQQDEQGFLPQNTYLDGRTRWGGEQLDNVAFPLVMAYQLRERHGHGFDEAAYGYDSIRASADYVARSGPETAQERWEEEGGFSPSTIAAEVAGLACAARLAADEGEREDALVYLGLADRWRDGVSEWCATTTGADGHEPPYYFRVNDDRDPDDGADRGLANGGPTLDERAVIDAGFLELVRLGIVPADDELVQNSLSVVDETIRVDTPSGPAWYRYNGDGYGEGESGAPWSVAPNTKGRLWPIFTGERAEYELRAGTTSGDLAPQNLLRTMARFANEGRMIPEQVWDREEPTEYGWAFGEGTGSATPLSWSMAQFVRLAWSLDVGEPVETPAFVEQRYVEGEQTPAPSLDVTFPDPVVDTTEVSLSGTTDAAEVVVRTGAETTRLPVSDGSFDATVTLAEGRNQITVVAPSGDDPLETVGLATARTSVSVTGS